MENIPHEPDHDPLGDFPATQSVDTTPRPRFDGWTPFARKLFLDVLADTGRVSLACEYSQRSRASAYALRARDPLFAAGWDAACELARAPLADALYERALDGTTETITRNGEVIAERHRHDNRLSIAVLNRLDKRCDRAEERGSRHLAVAANWQEWLAAIGENDAEAAARLLAEQAESTSHENAQHCQHCQLRLGGSPTDGDEEDPDAPEEVDCHDRCWKDDDGIWVTDFAPPLGFDGYSCGEWGERDYERACTEAEAEVLQAHEDACTAADRKDEEMLRDHWFALLREDLDPGPEAELADADAPRQAANARQALPGTPEIKSVTNGLPDASICLSSASSATSPDRNAGGQQGR